MKGIRQKCIGTRLLSSRRGERKICVHAGIWIILLNAVFLAPHIFRAPLSETIHLEPKYCTFPEGGAFHVVVHVCYVMECAHGERVCQSWLCKPNPPLGHSCLLLSLSFRSSFIRSELWLNRVQTVCSQKQEETRANRGVAGLIQNQPQLAERKEYYIHPEDNWPECSRTGWGGWDCGSPFLCSGTESLYLWICSSRPNSGTEGWDSFCLKPKVILVYTRNWRLIMFFVVF